MFKKIIISIVLASFVFVNAAAYFARSTHAQENTWYHQDWPEWHVRVFDSDPDTVNEIFGERYTAAQVEWVIYGLFSFLVNQFAGAGLSACVIEYGGSVSDFGLHCLDDLVTTFELWMGSIGDSSIINKEADSLAYHKNPVESILSGDRPISGIGYIKDTVSKFNPVSEVKAQGFGFEAARSIRELWRAVRNVTYFFLILMVLAMAFMIMFRFKISQTAVMTVQSALPKIIGALILITFSYAIAGFLIDLMYVVIGIVAAIFAQSSLFGAPPDWTYMYEALSGANFGQGIVGMMLIYLFFFILISLMALLSNIGGTVLFIGTIIVWVIVLIVGIIAMLFILLKTIWVLLKSYVSILLLIAVGPVYIITGGFVGWLKNLAGNLAVFAVTGPMLAIAFLFLANALPNGWAQVTGTFPGGANNLLDFAAGLLPFNPDATALGNSPWVPPFLPFGYDLDLVWLAASFIIMTLIPNVSNIIKSMLQGKPFGYGTAIGQAFGWPSAVGLGVAGSASAREQAKYLEAVKSSGPGGIGRGREVAHSIFNIVRGASGGRIK